MILLLLHSSLLFSGPNQMRTAAAKNSWINDDSWIDFHRRHRYGDNRAKRRRAKRRAKMWKTEKKEYLEDRKKEKKSKAFYWSYDSVHLRDIIGSCARVVDTYRMRVFRHTKKKRHQRISRHNDTTKNRKNRWQRQRWRLFLWSKAKKYKMKIFGIACRTNSTKSKRHTGNGRSIQIFGGGHLNNNFPCDISRSHTATETRRITLTSFCALASSTVEFIFSICSRTTMFVDVVVLSPGFFSLAFIRTRACVCVCVCDCSSVFVCTNNVEYARIATSVSLFPFFFSIFVAQRCHLPLHFVVVALFPSLIQRFLCQYKRTLSNERNLCTTKYDSLIRFYVMSFIAVAGFFFLLEKKHTQQKQQEKCRSHSVCRWVSFRFGPSTLGSGSYVIVIFM